MDSHDALREAEIRALALLERPMPDVLAHLTRVAALTAGVESAEINVITSSTQHTLVNAQGGSSEVAAEDSFCAKIVREPERAHVVPDARLDPRFRDSPFTRSGAVRSYASSQLVTRAGVPIGTLCVFDGELRDFDETTTRVLTEVADAIMDVLEGQRLHEEMHDALQDMSAGQRELRRSNEHLAAFAGQVSHDVQGPLAAVLLSLQMLEEDLAEAPRDVRMLLGSALSGAQRMRGTVAGLMDFAVVGGRLSPVPLDMDVVVAEVVGELVTQVGRARIEVEPLPKAYGDDVQVRAVVQNILANALKYAGHVDRPVIRVSGTSTGGRTRLAVSDNGPGVPVAQREEIFELHVRGDQPEHAGVDGLGIGLSTCRRIIEAHGGAIGVDDSPEGGAEFWFELPGPGGS